MPQQPHIGAVIAVAIEFTLAAMGALLAWRLVLGRAARARPVTPQLPPWTVAPLDLFLFLLHTLLGAIIASFIVALVVKPLGIAGDNLIIFSNAAAQLGLLAGVALYSLSYPGRLSLVVGSPREIIGSGLATFLISLPLVVVGGLLWTALLSALGLPLEKQLSVDLFARTESVPWVIVLGATAVLVAPMAEEMVFRAGLFRFCRTRLPRWSALLLPACLFAALHNNLPTFAQLATLGLVFSLAYERTGRIGTAMVAHAAFNLNNILLLVSGVNN